MNIQDFSEKMDNIFKGRRKAAEDIHIMVMQYNFSVWTIQEYRQITLLGLVQAGNPNSPGPDLALSGLQR